MTVAAAVAKIRNYAEMHLNSQMYRARHTHHAEKQEMAICLLMLIRKEPTLTQFGTSTQGPKSEFLDKDSYRISKYLSPYPTLTLCGLFPTIPDTASSL